VKLPAIAISVTALVIAAGCSRTSSEDVSDLTFGCHGQPFPVVEEVFLSTLGRYGFELYREDACPNGVGPPAMFANIPQWISDTPEADVIFASDSQVWCELYRRNRFGSEVRRTRLVERDEVVVRVLNVECRIYAVDPWHTERLGLAMKQLPKQTR
jgi:hypothetical protein